MRRNSLCSDQLNSDASRAVVPRSYAPTMSLMSAPAMKLDLAEEITAPLMAESATTLSMHLARSAWKPGVSTFIGRPSTSIFRCAMPSASTENWMFCAMCVTSSCVRCASDALDDRRGAHAAAHAERHERGREVPPLELVEHHAEDHGARGAERVAEGDRATVHVDLVEREVHVAREAQHHRGERLVDLPQVDVAGLHAGTLQRLARRAGRPGEHDGGFAADRGERAN